jgi:hypothetical protein
MTTVRVQVVKVGGLSAVLVAAIGCAVILCVNHTPPGKAGEVLSQEQPIGEELHQAWHVSHLQRSELEPVATPQDNSNEIIGSYHVATNFGGVVVNEWGRIVCDAEVRLVSLSTLTPFEAVTKSGQSGEFVFTEVPCRPVEVMVSKTGLRATRSGALSGETCQIVMTRE